MPYIIAYIYEFLNHNAVLCGIAESSSSTIEMNRLRPCMAVPPLISVYIAIFDQITPGTIGNANDQISSMPFIGFAISLWKPVSGVRLA